MTTATLLDRLDELLGQRRYGEAVPVAREVLTGIAQAETADLAHAYAAAGLALLRGDQLDEADMAFAALVALADRVDDLELKVRAAATELYRAEVAEARSDGAAVRRHLTSAWERSSAVPGNDGGGTSSAIRLVAAGRLAAIDLDAGDAVAAAQWIRAALSVDPARPLPEGPVAEAAAVARSLWANAGPEVAERLLVAVATSAGREGDRIGAGGAWLALGDLAASSGDHRKALQVFRTGLLDLGDVNGIPDAGLLRAELLTLAGVSADRLGEFAVAAALYEEALRLRRRHLPVGHPDVLLSRYNVAELARVSGDVELAETELAYVVDELDAGPGPGAPWLRALAGKNLALALLERGRPEEAAGQAVAALALDVADAHVRGQLLVALAQARERLGQPAGVEAQLAAAAEEVRAARGEDSVEYLWTLAESAASLPAERGREAEAIYGQVLDRVGARDPYLHGSTLANLAGRRWGAGDHHGALDALRASAALWEVARAERWRVRSALETDPREPWPLRHPVLVLVAEHLAADDDARRFAFRLAGGGKRLQAEALESQQRLVLEGHDDLLELQAMAAALRRTEAWGATLGAQATDERERLEALLAGQVPREALLRAFEQSTVEAVAGALPHGSVLVEYVRCPSVRLAGFDLGAEHARYLAFVLPAGDPERLALRDLGDARDIDDAAVAFGASIRGHGRDFGPDVGGDDRPARDWTERSRRLASLVWDPISAEVGDRDDVVIAPDGPLCAVAFDALLGRGGRPLLLDHGVSVLGTGRDAARLLYRPNWSSSPPLVVAAPSFGPPHRPFATLAGAAAEGRQVARLLKVRMVTGPHASRDAVLGADSPEILHLATHGFYLAPAGPSGELSERLMALAAHHPLLRSGVALAGANRSVLGTGVDPSAGLVSAIDALGMELMGTDLVVLSACETGLGPVEDEEGLMGLARSFLLAGARSVVWSLWKVDDAATADLMVRFYRRLLVGHPRTVALRLAKRDLFGSNPDRPEVWAAFTLQGDLGPLLRYRALLPPSEQLRPVVAERVDGIFRLSDAGKPFATFELDVGDGGGEPIRVGSFNGRNLSVALASDKQAEALQAFTDGGPVVDAYAKLVEALSIAANAPSGRLLAARIRANLVIVAGLAGDLPGAKRYARRALTDFEKLMVSEEETAVLLDNAGSVAAKLGDLAGARAHFERALAIKEAVLVPGSSQIEFTQTRLRELAATGA